MFFFFFVKKTFYLISLIMGATCTNYNMGCCPNCCGATEYRKIINTEVKNQDWADAVSKNNLIGIKYLHHDDPGLVNEPVDEYGGMAIHYAIKNKNEKLLEYLLNNGANVNVQGGPNYNSPLHEATLLQDFTAIRKLFSYGINDQLKNNHGKMAINLCNKKLKREFAKSKKFRKKHKAFYLQRNAEESKSNGVMLAGMDLNDTNESTIRKYVKETDHAQNFYRRKKEEIDNRDMAVTTFGDETGVDCDEIAYILYKIPDLGKVWQKLAKRNTSITKQTEIYKILYSLTVMTLRKKNPRSKKPPVQPIKRITALLCKQLPKNKGKTTLEKEFFVKEFHTVLFKLHDELVEQESMI
eukprot:435381_1